MGFVLKGTIVNGAAIIVGGLLGVLLGGRIPEGQACLRGLLSCPGYRDADGVADASVLIISAGSGGREKLLFDALLQRAGTWLERRAALHTPASSCFCICHAGLCQGAMTGAQAVVGPTSTLYVWHFDGFGIALLLPWESSLSGFCAGIAVPGQHCLRLQHSSPLPY